VSLWISNVGSTWVTLNKSIGSFSNMFYTPISINPNLAAWWLKIVQSTTNGCTFVLGFQTNQTGQCTNIFPLASSYWDNSNNSESLLLSFLAIIKLKMKKQSPVSNIITWKMKITLAVHSIRILPTMNIFSDTRQCCMIHAIQ